MVNFSRKRAKRRRSSPSNMLRLPARRNDDTPLGSKIVVLIFLKFDQSLIVHIQLSIESEKSSCRRFLKKSVVAFSCARRKEPNAGSVLSVKVR